MSEKLKVDIDVEDAEAAAKLARFEKLAKKNQEAFSKFGGAVSGVGRFMGSTTSAAGGLLAEFGQIAGVLGSTGALGVGLVTATAGIALLVQQMNDAAKATEDLEKKQDSLFARIVAIQEKRSGAGKLREDEIAYTEAITELEENRNHIGQIKANLDQVIATGSVFALRRELAERERILKSQEDALSLARRLRLEGDLSDLFQPKKQAGELSLLQKIEGAAIAAQNRGDEERKKAYADAMRAERDAMRLTRQRMDAENRDDLDKLQRFKELDKKREEAGKAELKRIEERNRAETKKLDDEEASIIRLAEKKNQLHLEEMNRKREEAERAAGYALEVLSFASGQVVAIAQLEAQLQTARVNGNADMVRQLEEQEKQLAAAIAAATLEQIAQIAIAHGTVLFMRGVGEMALGNAGAGVAVAQGLGLVAIGVAGMTGAGVIRGVAAGSQPPIGGTGDTSAPSFDSAPRQLAAPGQSGGGNVTTTYIVNGPAFGLNEDRAQRWAYGANRRGARLEGLRP